VRIAYLSIGGHIHTIRWLRYFVERGHEVHLMTVQPSPIEGVTVHDIRTGVPVKPLHYAIALGHVRRLLARIRPDILHTHFLTGYGYWGAFSGFHPHVLTVWGDDVYVTPHETRLKGWLAGRALRGADLVTGDSEDIIEHAVRMGARRDACHVVQWGVDLDRFRPGAPSDVRERLGIDAGAPVVISTRSFTQRYYNIELIIETIPRVLERHPGTRFIVAGNEGDDTELRELAGRLGVADSTTFVGRIQHDELPAWLAASDVFLTVPSVDATAVSLLEAMAAGVPVVTSNLESAMEWVVDGESGLAVPPGDGNALLEAVCRLIESPDLRVRLGAKAAEIVKERADHRAHMARMELLMETLLGEWRRHRGR
jgi:glycosyltransferase involved in cell wall biosynthesis